MYSKKKGDLKLFKINWLSNIGYKNVPDEGFFFLGNTSCAKFDIYIFITLVAAYGPNDSIQSCFSNLYSKKILSV